MIYVSGLIKVDDQKYIASEICYHPFDEKYGVKKTIEEMRRDGYLIEDKTYEDVLNEEREFRQNNPAPPNSVLVRYFNPETMCFFYEYEIIQSEPTSDEQIILTLGNLLLENAQLKVQVQDLETIQGQLLIEIAQLKTQVGGNQ